MERVTYHEKVEGKHGQIGDVGGLGLLQANLLLNHALIREGERAALVEEEGVAPEHQLGPARGAGGEGDEGVVNGHTV